MAAPNTPPSIKMPKLSPPHSTDKPLGSHCDQFPSNIKSDTSITALHHLIATQYSIVKKIFDYLPLRDLLTCAQTCKEWSIIAQTVRKNRKNQHVYALFQPLQSRYDTKLVFDYYNGVFNDEVPDEFTNYEQLKPAEGQIFLNKVEDFIQKFSFECFHESQLFLVFCTSSVFECYKKKKSTSSSSGTQEQPRKSVLSKFPQSIPSVACFSYGAIATTLKTNEIFELENGNFPLVSFLGIPRIQGLRIQVRKLTQAMRKEWKRKVNMENCCEIIGVSSTDTLKGILMFSTNSISYPPTCPFVAALNSYLRINSRVAIGGGAQYRTMCNSYLNPDESQRNDCVGSFILIYGDDNVNVASVGLFDSKITKNNEDKLKLLKQSQFKDGYSFALMFACTGRGMNMHGGSHVESSLFRKYFPTTPLIGTFTGGEYCHEYVVKQTGEKPSPQPTVEIRAKGVEYAYTTVFVLVSYRHV